MVKYLVLLMHDQSEKKMFNSSKPVKTVIFFVFEQIKKTDQNSMLTYTKGYVY